MSEADRQRAEKAREFEHKRGPATFYVRAQPTVTAMFRLRNVPAGLEKDQQAFDILCESVIGWQGVPWSWLDLKAESVDALEFTRENVADLLRARADLMLELSDALVTFETGRALLIGLERKNFEST